jgi:hypothetical protein
MSIIMAIILVAEGACIGYAIAKIQEARKTTKEIERKLLIEEIKGEMRHD